MRKPNETRWTPCVNVTDRIAANHYGDPAALAESLGYTPVAESIPPRSLVAICGKTMVDGQLAYLVCKPSSYHVATANAAKLAVTGETPIPTGRFGVCTQDWPAEVRISSNAISQFSSRYYGPATGEWRADGTGQTFTEVARPGPNSTTDNPTAVVSPPGFRGFGGLSEKFTQIAKPWHPLVFADYHIHSGIARPVSAMYNWMDLFLGIRPVLDPGYDSNPSNPFVSAEINADLLSGVSPSPWIRDGWFEDDIHYHMGQSEPSSQYIRMFRVNTPGVFAFGFQATASITDELNTVTYRSETGPDNGADIRVRMYKTRDAGFADASSGHRFQISGEDDDMVLAEMADPEVASALADDEVLYLEMTGYECYRKQSYIKDSYGTVEFITQENIAMSGIVECREGDYVCLYNMTPYNVLLGQMTFWMNHVSDVNKSNPEVTL